MSGRYTLEDARDLDLGVVSDYCMAMSFRSLGDLVPRNGSSHGVVSNRALIGR